MFFYLSLTCPYIPLYPDIILLIPVLRSCLASVKLSFYYKSQLCFVGGFCVFIFNCISMAGFNLLAGKLKFRPIKISRVICF